MKTSLFQDKLRVENKMVYNERLIREIIEISNETKESS